MKTSVTKLLLLIFLMSISGAMSAQIFGGIMNEAKRKIGRKIEDKIVDAVSDELARRAFRPIEVAIDSMMRQKYQDSMNGGKDVDWDKAGAAYADFLNGMNRVVELPEKYTFDITQEVEMTDYSNKKNEIKIHYSKDGAYMGMENIDDKDTKQFIIMDVGRDAMVLYSTDKKGKKTAQTIPNVMKFAGAMVRSVAKDSLNNYDYKISKTGKNKKIAGYTGEEYKGSSKDEDMTMYVSENFPIKVQDNFSAYFNQFTPAAYKENAANIKNGVMLEYENVRKEGKGESTTWKTKKINEKSFNIVTKDYEFNQAGK